MPIVDLAAHRRRSALISLQIFTLPAAGIFVVFNLMLGAEFLALLDLGLILVSAKILVAAYKKARLETLAQIYLLTLFVILCSALTRPDIHPGMESWLPMMPMLAYLLLPPHRALRVATVSLLAAIAAYLAGAEDTAYRLEPIRLAHMITPTLALFVVCHFYVRDRIQSEEDLLERVFTDPLTELWNREKLLSEFEHEQKRSQRSGAPLSLILIDLDQFKKLNDRYGHEAGDAALVFVARLLESRLRDTDLVCRLGGEEFVALLPDTDKGGAMTAAQNLRQTLEASPFDYHEEHICITMSAGVVEFGKDGEDWSHLYRAADARLYACKERGRNCVIGSLET